MRHRDPLPLVIVFILVVLALATAARMYQETLREFVKAREEMEYDR